MRRVITVCLSVSEEKVFRNRCYLTGVGLGGAFVKGNIRQSEWLMRLSLHGVCSYVTSVFM